MSILRPRGVSAVKSGMRVLVHLNNLSLGGTQLNALDFADGVRPHGVESVLIGPRDTLPGEGPSLLDVARERGQEIQVFDRPPTAAQSARHLESLAEDARADLVHVYGQGTMRGAYLGPCRWGRRGLVQTAYEMSVGPYTMRGHELIVGTGYLEEELRSHGHVTLISPPVDLVRDSPDAVDGRALREALRLPEDAIHIVIVSRLDVVMKAPAIEIAMSCLTRLDRQDVHLTVVGTGDSEASLRAAGDAVNSRLGREAVRFTGAMSDPRQAYASADIAVGMGGSAARALAFGRPLIVQGENGWSELFSPDSSAAIFRRSFWSAEAVEDPVGLMAATVETLAADRTRWPELGQFSRQFAEQHFGAVAMCQRLADVYEAAASGYGVRRWALDLDLEARAALYLAQRKLPGRTRDEFVGEYKFPPPRRRSRANP